MSCDHKSTFSIGGKTCDMSSWTFHSGLTGDGYVPDFMGSNSSYLELSVCIYCHQLLSFDEGLQSSEEDGRKKITVLLE